MRSWGIIIIQGLFIFILCVTGLIIPSISCSASSNCSVPPFVATGVKPNVIIMLDNSGSMKVPMYNDTDFGGWRCNNGTHDDFDPSQTYYGIFDSNKKYRYDSAIPVDPDPWQSGDPYKISVDTTMKGAFVEDNSCTCGSGKNCWDGNFLNWLVTRRIDAARKALVGGKMESRAGYDYITGDGGDLEWKILGNNEPSDGDFCKKYSNSSSYSPFPDNTTFKIYSPANNGSVKSSYDPYAKIEAQGSVAITIKDSSGKDIGEIGTVSIKHHWVTVDLCRKYTDPIVVAGPLSYNGSDPSLVRIKNVTSRSFKIRVQEWMYKDGTHTTEYVHYMVIEKGTHTLPGGKKLVAGKVNVTEYIDRYPGSSCSGSATQSWKTVTLPVPLTNPVVKTSVVTFNGSDTVTTRVKQVTSARFKVTLEEEEKGKVKVPHPSETVTYVVVEKGRVDFGNGVKMEAGTTGDNVTHQWKTINFSSLNSASIFLADMQTTDGIDTATLRYKDLSSSSVKIFIEEEKSCDSETNHTTENVGYIAFETGTPYTYNIALVVEEEPKGIVQDVADKVRLGISFYRYTKDSDIYNGERKDGGTLRLYIPKNPFVKNNSDIRSSGGYRTLETHVKADVDDVVDAIEHYPLVWGTTPLAENMYEVVRYYRQDSPYYSSDDYQVSNDWDPYYYSEVGSKQKCANAFIVVFTDGEPYRDWNVPSISGCAGTGGPGKYSKGPDCDNDGNEPKSSVCLGSSSSANHDYLDDVAYWAHESDMRSDLDGDQTITTYSVIFGVSEVCGEHDNETDCENAGCSWQDDECRPGTDSENCRQTIMEDTAENGGGEFYYASDADELAQAFTSIMENIIRSASAGAVATVSQEVQGEDIIVRGAFETYLPEDPNTFVWRGHLESYWPYDASSIDNQEDCENAGCTWSDGECSGNTYGFLTHSGEFCSDHHDHCWDAEERLPSTRTIFTVIDGTKTEFDTSNVSTLSPYLDNDIDFNSDGSVNSLDTKALIKWVLGDTTYDGDTARDRGGWVLGDIVYSTPVVVGAPSLASVSESAVGDCSCISGSECSDSCAKQCFYCYRNKYIHRKQVVYVGANDGMLHAFLVGKWDDADGEWIYDPDEDSDIGRELWAYIPSNLLSELKELARPTYGTQGGCQHRYMVDLSPEAWDVYIDHDNDGTREWRTVLIGGERGGGDVYFAIDVTDPDNPIVLWEYSVLRNMVQIHASGTNYEARAPYLDKDDYDQVKNLPLSWSIPYLGRLSIPSSAKFLASPRTITPLETVSSLAKPVFKDKNDLSEWFAFIGGGFRVFDPDTELSVVTDPDERREILKPYFLAIDIETGINIFQYIWALLRNTAESEWPEETSSSNYIPYAMTNPLVLDIWDSHGSVGSDGYVDHIYLGDLNGLFYGMKFNMVDSKTTTNGLKIDVWRAKPVSSSASTNDFRSGRQPITTTPVAAFDPDKNLRLYFGTGKFDNVGSGNDDKTDTAKMSFYSLKDATSLPELTKTRTVSYSGHTFLIPPSSSYDFTIENSDFVVNMDSHCDSTSFNSGCTWVKSDGTEDCCESSCSGSCWNCVYDFTTDGERVTDSALVTGSLVFFVTFVPNSDSCTSGGDAYLYVMDYLCRAMTSNPLENSNFYVKELKNGDETVGYRVKLNKESGKGGVPSRPVLDSSGEHVLIQTSDAKVHRVKVDLPEKPLYMKGWKEEAD